MKNVENIFDFADDLGPHKVVHVHVPSIGLKGILVVDNVAMGPSIGGLRIATDVSVEECVRLARAMTMKNAAAGIRHGGGKTVLMGDPNMDKDKKELLLRGMCRSLEEIEDYIFAPDMGTNEECMAWIKDEIGRVVGLPREIGGIPLDEIGITGFGLSTVAEVAVNYCDLELKGARVVIQGFGSVGKNAAKFLQEKGAVIVGVGDSHGSICQEDGLDVEELIKFKKSGKSVKEYAKGKSCARDDVIDMECDIWIPAARPDIINEDNAERLKCKLIVSGANIPITLGAEKILHEKGILIVPDFIANAGGVICAAMEYEGARESKVFEVVKDKLTLNTKLVLDESKKEDILPREAATRLATERVKKAMSFKRWGIF